MRIKLWTSTKDRSMEELLWLEQDNLKDLESSDKRHEKLLKAYQKEIQDEIAERILLDKE